MIRKFMNVMVALFLSLGSCGVLGMYIKTKTPPRRPVAKKSLSSVQKITQEGSLLEQEALKEKMVSIRLVGYAAPLGMQWGEKDEVTQEQAIGWVKDYIKKEIFDEVGNLEFPTPASKIAALNKKVDILPFGIEYDDQFFTQACDELIQEIKDMPRNAYEKKKDAAIDAAIVRFKKHFAASKNIYKDVIGAMGINNRALVAIALQQECKDCMMQQFGEDKYEQLVVESRRRSPMDEERKSSFEERKKKLAELLRKRSSESSVNGE